MATHTLMQFFEDVYKKELPYCAVCLRSEKEVRLSAPLVFKRVLGALKYLDSFKNEKVCYMCEARASSVVRFLDMVQLAMEIQKALQKSLQTKRKIWRKRVLESTFTKMRTRSQLDCTQVLQVDSAMNSNLIGSDKMSQSMKMKDKTIPLDVETVIIDDDSSQMNSITTVPNLMDPIGTGNFMYFIPMNTVLPPAPAYLLPTTSSNTKSVQKNSNSESRTDIVDSKSKRKKSESNICSSPIDKKSRKTHIIDDDIEIHIDDDDDDRITGNKMLKQMLESEARVPFRPESGVDCENMNNNPVGSKGTAKLNGKKEKTTPSRHRKKSISTDTNLLNTSNGVESNNHCMPVVTVLPTNSTYVAPNSSGNTQSVQQLDSESETDSSESNSRKEKLYRKPPYRKKIANLSSPSIELVSTIDKLCSTTIDKLCSPPSEGLSLPPTGRLSLPPSQRLSLPPSEGLSLPRSKRLCSPKTEVIDDDIEYIVTDDDDDTLEPQVIKAPIRRDSRVDWEDMIPMELIACADDKSSAECSLTKVKNDLLKDLEIVINMGGVIK